MRSLSEKARQLRNNLTGAEKYLWYTLRVKNINGCKFRRQQPIGEYIVDFVCFQKKLVVEIDGGQHSEQADLDKDRNAWLKSQGFVVLRFWNNEVLKNREGVLEEIKRYLLSTLPSFESERYHSSLRVED